MTFLRVTLCLSLSLVLPGLLHAQDAAPTPPPAPIKLPPGMRLKTPPKHVVDTTPAVVKTSPVTAAPEPAIPTAAPTAPAPIHVVAVPAPAPTPAPPPAPVAAAPKPEPPPTPAAPVVAPPPAPVAAAPKPEPPPTPAAPVVAPPPAPVAAAPKPEPPPTPAAPVVAPPPAPVAAAPKPEPPPTPAAPVVAPPPAPVAAAPKPEPPPAPAAPVAAPPPAPVAEAPKPEPPPAPAAPVAATAPAPTPATTTASSVDDAVPTGSLAPSIGSSMTSAPPPPVAPTRVSIAPSFTPAPVAPAPAVAAAPALSGTTAPSTPSPADTTPTGTLAPTISSSTMSAPSIAAPVKVVIIPRPMAKAPAMVVPPMTKVGNLSPFGSSARPASAPTAVTPTRTNTSISPTVKAPAASTAAPKAPRAPRAPVPAGAFVADKIVFDGAGPYSQDELAAAIGITDDTILTDSVLSTANQHLVDTGLFSDASASTQVEDNVHTLTFALKPVPSSQLARASFANLVWLSPAEIEAGLSSVQLYHGLLPVANTSPVADQVKAALTQMLAAKSVTANLTYTLIAPSIHHPFITVEYRVTDPVVKLAHVNVTGAPGTLLNAELAAQAAALTAPYNEGTAGDTIADLLLAPERNAGYIGAKLTDVSRTRHPMGHTISVDYTARIVSGPLYRVGRISWPGGPVLTAAEFERESPLRRGDIPTDARLGATEKIILSAYQSKGYIDAHLDTVPTLEASQAMVNYAFAVTPGDIYRVRNVVAQGLSPAAQQEFDSAFTLKSGDLFDGAYLGTFLQNNRSLTALNRYTYSYQTATNPETHQVDITLSFRPV